jgi:protein associated with RNAse G/E
MTWAKIHLSRIHKPVRHFTDGFIEEDKHRLKTHTVIPESISLPWSETFQQQGRIPHGQVIGSVSKYLFFDRYFSIMEIRSTTGNILGYYVDIATPVRKDVDEYYLEDLILDLWIFPDRTYLVLDEEEWEQAVSAGWIAEDIQRTVLRTLKRIKREIKGGRFPQAYIETCVYK